VRRLLTEAASYVTELAGLTRSGWNAFFFSPADPTPVGFIRVAAGLLAFWSLLVLGLDLHDYFGATGWADAGVIQSMARPFSWSFWFLVPDAWLRPVWCLCLAVLALFALGCFSRVSAVLSWIIVVSTIRRVPHALYGFDQILSVLMLYLMVTGASGQSVSLDRFWRRWRQARARAATVRAPEQAGSARLVMPDEPAVPAATVSSNLTLRLIQLHLVLIYAMAGLAKLEGPSWWSGLALWKTMTTGEFVALDFTALAAWPLLVNLLTHASLALELLYPALVWVRVLRPLVLAGMVALHAGIAVINPGLSEFGLAMVAANIAFVSGVWLRACFTGTDQPALRVLFDGACPRCRASMALVTAADRDHVVEPVDLTAVDARSIHPSLTPADCLRSMHVVSRAGRVTAGFDGVRSLACRLPLFWPLALMAFLPGVAWLGRRVYNKIAAGRPRDIPCTDEFCAIHSHPRLAAPRDRSHAQHPTNAIATVADTKEAPRS
jgi:predicted DCC family thiol-disulfide oxidoreductase YuxK